MILPNTVALYTTLLGWQQYQSLWNIAAGTGLVYLPLLSLLITPTFAAFTSGLSLADAALVALKKLLVNLITALLIIGFAAVPYVPLNPSLLQVETLCHDEAAPATPGHTKTTYDHTFPIPTGVKVPLIWYVVMAVSSGITHAASIALPCAPLDYRALQTQLETTQIEDPQLKQTVAQFYHDCYLPAYSHYLNQRATGENHTPTPSKDDLGWLGSATLLNQPGFYDSQQASQSIAGFHFNAHRDGALGQLASTPTYGMPTCQEWWNDPQHGLHQQLKKTLPPTFWQQIISVDDDRQTLEDAAIKTLLTHNPPQTSFSDQLRGYASLNNNVSGDYFSRFVGARIGVARESMSFYPKLHLLINALPVIQGVVLFALYAFLAFGIVFSSYRIHFCVTGAVMMFSVTFCSFLWHLVQWLDHVLMESLYPRSDEDTVLLGVLSSLTFNHNQILVDMIIGTLYLVLPIGWLMVMNWAGFRAGYEMSSLFGSLSHPAQQSGQQVDGVARKFLL